jgi:hypothetical protein
MTCEVFEYSNEKFDTGIPEIDAIQKHYDLDIFNWSVMTEDNEMLMTEDGDYLILEEASMEDLIDNADNEDIKDEGDEFIDFDSKDPFKS